jgi:hypothetical protein
MDRNELIHRKKKMLAATKAKEIAYMNDMVHLTKIQKEKRDLIQEIQRLEKEYMTGIEHINTRRQSGDRLGLDILEYSVEFMKAKWFESKQDWFVKCEEEKAQMHQVIRLKRSIQTQQKMIGKYSDNIRYWDEQKQDREAAELAIRGERR